MVLELERTTPSSEENFLPEEGISVPIEEYRLDILEIRRLMAEIAGGTGFEKAVAAKNKRIYKQYGERTHEVASGKKNKTERLYEELYKVLRRDAALNIGLDRDDVNFEESSIRREIKELYAKREKDRTDEENDLLERLETPIIEYPEESLQQYEELVRSNPKLAGRRTADDYRRSVQDLKFPNQDAA